MHVLVDHRKLPGTGAHALDHRVNRLAKTWAQAGSFTLVPTLHVDELIAGGSGEDNRMH